MTRSPIGRLSDGLHLANGGSTRRGRAIQWSGDPFSGSLSARSSAYALTVLSALFRWLIEQCYVLANPFAGVKVRGHALRPALDITRGFTEGEWVMLRTIRRWPRVVIRMVGAGSTTTALPVRLRLRDGPACQRADWGDAWRCAR